MPTNHQADFGQIATNLITQARAFNPEENDIWKRLDTILTNSGADISIRSDDLCAYQPPTDNIVLTPPNVCSSEEEFYAKAIHELAHWTGAKHRLNRPFMRDPWFNRFKAKYRNPRRFMKGVEYAQEEITAELACGYVLNKLGWKHHNGFTVSYLASYLKDLDAEGDGQRRLSQALQDAQAAGDLIMSYEHRAMPASTERWSGIDQPALDHKRFGLRDPGNGPSLRDIERLLKDLGVAA